MSRKVTKKKAISMALAAALTLSSITVPAFAAASDINGHWAEKTITAWQEKGLISGYEDGSFKPDRQVTRAEFVVIMNNALGLTEEGEVSFSDVKAENWFYKAVSIAVEAGYVNGYEDGTFKPNATITRAEAAVMIAQAKGLKADESGADKFSDEVPAWAKGYVGAVVNAGYMSGYPDGTFGATKSITRAEAVSSLDRVIGGTTSDDVVTDKDLVVDTANQVVEGETVEGNLIISEDLGSGSATIKDTVVEGDLIIKGGANAITLDNVTVKGKTIIEKDGVRVELKNGTTLDNVELKEVATIAGDGEIGTLTVAEDLGTTDAAIVRVPAEKINVNEKANLQVEANVEELTVAEDAAGSKVTVLDDVTVDTVVADGKVALAGQGTIKRLEVNADDVTISNNLDVKDMVVASGVEKPVQGNTSSSGGGGSSHRPNKPGTSTEDKVVAKVDVTASATTIKAGEKVELTAKVANKAGTALTAADVKSANWTVEDATGAKVEGATATVDSEDKLKATLEVTDKVVADTELTVKLVADGVEDIAKVTVKAKGGQEVATATGTLTSNENALKITLPDGEKFAADTTANDFEAVKVAGGYKLEIKQVLLSNKTKTRAAINKEGYDTATLVFAKVPENTAVEVTVLNTALVSESTTPIEKDKLATAPVKPTQEDVSVKVANKEGTQFDTIKLKITNEGAFASDVTSASDVVKVSGGSAAIADGGLTLEGGVLTIKLTAPVSEAVTVSLKDTAFNTEADIVTAEYVTATTSDSSKITEVSLSGLVAPVEGAAADTDVVVAEGANYTASAVTWSPEVSDAFAVGTAYTATITLTANEGLAFTADTAVSVYNETAGDLEGATVKAKVTQTTRANDTLTVTVTFPELTETQKDVTDIEVTGIENTHNKLVLTAGQSGKFKTEINDSNISDYVEITSASNTGWDLGSVASVSVSEGELTIVFNAVSASSDSDTINITVKAGAFTSDAIVTSVTGATSAKA
ncbi:MAG: S-layer homology domain-containing protein [Tyzzerella sp.]|uniref:S-layer homology domain-containing protein n=1 Tax=Candidatus Fimicola merdigallinarum TaxID=2840819 RepID=A0A9D9H2I7_9FIRM|nr:S-layer homology domain-containing protein [Candidatus Fimicola merdigallinarum]